MATARDIKKQDAITDEMKVDEKMKAMDIDPDSVDYITVKGLMPQPQGYDYSIFPSMWS